jgi:hypothetical protein
MKAKLFVFILILLSLSGCALMGGDRSVNISETELQKKLNDRLAVPISLLKIFNISLSNSLVKFDEKTGRMTSSFDTHVTSVLTDKPVAGQLGISGKLRFDPTDNSIKLDDPKIEQVSFSGLTGKNSELLTTLAQQLGSEVLNGLTLYTIKQEDLKYGGRQYHPKSLQVINNQLQMTFSPIQ